MSRDRLTAAHGVKTFACLSFKAHASDIHAKHQGQTMPHGWNIGRQLGLLGQDGSIYVAAGCNLLVGVTLVIVCGYASAERPSLSASEGQESLEPARSHPVPRFI